MTYELGAIFDFTEVTRVAKPLWLRDGISPHERRRLVERALLMDSAAIEAGYIPDACHVRTLALALRTAEEEDTAGDMEAAGRRLRWWQSWRARALW